MGPRIKVGARRESVEKFHDASSKVRNLMNATGKRPPATQSLPSFNVADFAVGLPPEPLPTARDEPRRVLPRVLARAHQRASPPRPQVRLPTRRPPSPPRGPAVAARALSVRP